LNPAAVHELLGRVVRREALAADGKSGTSLERAWLGDGTRLVIKHVDPEADWIMQATGDDCRVVGLWDEGAFAAMPASIDHAMLGVARTDSGAMVVMRDVGPALFDRRGTPTREEHRRILRAVSDLHETFRDTRPEHLCSLATRCTFLAPVMWEPFVGRYVIARLAVDGWSRFHDVAAPDVAAAVAAIHDDPSALVEALGRRPATLLHGDLKMDNLGLVADRLVAIDWGTLTSWAPPAIDYAWYIAINAAALGIDHDSLLSDVRDVEGSRHDEVAMRLALLTMLAQLGWEKALGATSDDEGVRQRERAGLRWWEAQARAALESWPA
jgi:hypothetical protein